MAADQEYVIISDDDGHNYVCPADKQGEAAKAIESIEAYWADPDDGGDPPDLPDYLTPIGGALSRVKFKQFRID